MMEYKFHRNIFSRLDLLKFARGARALDPMRVSSFLNHCDPVLGKADIDNTIFYLKKNCPEFFYV